MDKSTDQNRKKTTTNNEERLRKGAVLQLPGPGRAFQGVRDCETVLQERFNWR